MKNGESKPRKKGTSTTSGKKEPSKTKGSGKSTTTSKKKESSTTKRASTVQKKEAVPKKVEDNTIKVVNAKGEQKEYASIEEFVNNEEEKKAARELGQWIQDHVGKNWFDLRRYMRKTGLNENGARLQLLMLKEFGLCLFKYDGNRTLFKVSFEVGDYIEMAKAEIKGLEVKLAIANNELKKLEQKKKDLEKENK